MLVRVMPKYTRRQSYLYTIVDPPCTVTLGVTHIEGTLNRTHRSLRRTRRLSLSFKTKNVSSFSDHRGERLTPRTPPRQDDIDEQESLAEAVDEC